MTLLTALRLIVQPQYYIQFIVSDVVICLCASEFVYFLSFYLGDTDDTKSLTVL